MKIITEGIENILKNAHKSLTLEEISEELIKQGLVKAKLDMSLIYSDVRSRLYIMVSNNEVIVTSSGAFKYNRV